MGAVFKSRLKLWPNGLVIKTLSIVGAKIWNSIPESYRRLPKHIFKKKIQALLIVTLETMDSYADINTLISEIKKAFKSYV